MMIEAGPGAATSLESAYADLIRRFPALSQFNVSRGGKTVFQRTNPGSRENPASVLFRRLTGAWAALFSSPSETFRHHVAERFNIRSAAKSIVALLVGIALRDGLIASVDQTLGELLPQAFTPTIEPEKREISLRHLLTMTSGLASMESGANAFRMFAARNWTHFMLSLPLVGRPGEKFIYNSANPHLVSAILSRLSGQSLLEYANRSLFEPLGIRDVVWGAGPEGTTFGGGNLFLSADELARIGELCLRRGEWDGQELVPRAWFDEMWQARQEFFPGWNYGYYWYLHDEIDPKTGRRFSTFSAAGSGGQKLLLIPELELVLAAVALTDFVGERGMALNQFISTQLVDAVRQVP